MAVYLSYDVARTNRMFLIRWAPWFQTLDGSTWAVSHQASWYLFPSHSKPHGDSMLSTTKAVNLPFNLVPAPYLAITPAIQSTHSPVSGGWKRAQHWNHVIKSSASGFDQCLLCSFAFFLSAIAITIAADDILTGLVRDFAASRCPPPPPLLQCHFSEKRSEKQEPKVCRRKRGWSPVN